MNYLDFKKQKDLKELEKNLIDISNNLKNAKGDLNELSKHINKEYYNELSASPIPKLETKIEELYNKIDDTILIHIKEELASIPTGEEI